MVSLDEYIEEALAQCTSSWTPSASSSWSPSALSAVLPAMPLADRLPLAPSIEAAEVESLSARTAKAEELIERLGMQLRSELAELRDSVVIDSDGVGVLSGTKLHALPQGTLELPRPCWATACGWRFGGCLGASVSIVPLAKAASLEHTRCARCDKRRAFGNWQEGASQSLS